MMRAPGGVTGMVVRALEGDVVLRDALVRRLVSVRQAARWLVKAEGWSGVELEAVVSALRRHRPESGDEPFAEARAILKRTHVNLRSRVCSLQLPNSAQVQRGLPRLCSAIDPTKGESLRILSSERGFHVYLDERNLDRAVQAFPDITVPLARRDLTEIGLLLPKAAEGTSGVLALVSSRLALRGITPEAAFDGPRQVVLLVNDASAGPAYAALRSLTSSASPSR